MFLLLTYYLRKKKFEPKIYHRNITQCLDNIEEVKFLKEIFITHEKEKISNEERLNMDVFDLSRLS